MQALPISGANFCTTSGALTATGAETVHDTTVTISYAIDGKAYTKTAITDGTTPTTDVNTGDAFVDLTANQGCIFLWCLDSSGNVKVAQGAVQTLNAGTFVLPPQFPDVSDSYTPFAYMVAKAGATAGTVTFGTSNWNATGFTNAIVNIFVVPNRPQVS